MKRMPVSRVVGILTDFGTRSQYISEMKALLICEIPDIRIVDISHQVHRHAVEEGAFLLYAASRWFPEGSILIGVVDPGVGTARAGLIVSTRRNYYVGPDNGLLFPSIQADGESEAFVIDEAKLPKISNVFHGRDVFSRAAIHMLRGRAIEEIAHGVQSIVPLELFKTSIRPDSVNGKVLFIDDFGNLVTNIKSAPFLDSLPFGSLVKLKLDGRDFGTVVYSDVYGRVPEGTLMLLKGSELFYEIAINRGSAADRTGAKVTSEIQIALLGPQ